MIDTKADQKRDKAKEHISKAYDLLLETLMENSAGGINGDDIYNENYTETIHHSLMKLKELKRIL